jgi:hypothetical protein
MKSAITRIYPIRTTRQHWNIPLFNYHICSEECSIIEVQYENLILNINNPDYKIDDKKCGNSDKIESTVVNISKFDINNPRGLFGPLYDPDMIIIPDTIFHLSITFPLFNGVDISIRSPTSKGLTLKELIFSIKKLYEFIYQEEERTAIPDTYHLKKDCEKCVNTSILDYVKEIVKSENDLECSICYSNFVESEKLGELSCKHIYHKHCISEWLLNSPHKNCPLCRQYVYICSECNGSGCIYYDFSGTVIPIEHRGIITNRNTTNGIFGIYGYDFEDLLLKKMIYNRISKKLSIFIGS